MIVEITKEQFSKLEMLSQIGDYYLDNMEPSSSCYEDDKESVTQAQDVLQQIEQQILNSNSSQLIVDIKKIFDCAIRNGATEYDYSFFFIDAFSEIYPAVSNAYAGLLKSLIEE
jgi:hypothetical protein